MSHNIPRGWIETLLGSVVDFQYGKALPERNRDSTGVFDVYGSSGVVGKHSACLVEGPCLVIGRKGSVGSVFLSKNNCWPIDTTYFVRAKPCANVEFLYRLLEFLRLGKLDRSTAIPGLNREDAYKLKILLPPLAEQHRIVEKIETLFAQLDQGEAALRHVQTLLARYRQSVLKAAVTGELTAEWRAQRAGQLEHGRDLLARILKARRENWQGRGKYKEPVEPDTSNLPELPEGWVWASVSQLAHVIGGLTKNSKRSSMPLKRPMLRVANVYQNRLDLSDIHETGVTEADLERVLLEPLDLLVVEGNGSKDQIGRMTIWRGEIAGAIHQNHLIKVRMVEQGLVELVLWWFQSPGGRLNIEKVASSTSGLYTLSISKIESLVTPVPSIEEAREINGRISEIFSRIDQLEASIEHELIRETALRQSILKDAFSGKLVPQDPNDEPASELLARIKAAHAVKSKKNSRLKVLA